MTDLSWKRKRLSGNRRASSLLVAMLLAVGLAILSGCGPDKAENSDLGKPLPLVDGPGLQLGEVKSGLALTAVHGEQGFVSHLDSQDELTVGALNLPTSTPLWPARKLGKYGDLAGIAIVNDSLMVMGERDQYGNGDADRTLFVLDPVTGNLKWQTEFDVNDGDLEFFQNTVVVRASNEPVTKGLDPKTGATKWTIPNPAGAVVETLGVKPATGPELNDATAPYSDSRLILLSENKSMRVYDVNTGALLRTQENVAAGAESFAYDGVLYGVSSSKVQAYDLSQAAAPRTVYTSKHKDLEITSCGNQRLCVTEGMGETTRLIAVDVKTGRQLWDARANTAKTWMLMSETPMSIGENVIWSDTVYGADGKVILKAKHSRKQFTQLRPLGGQTLVALTANIGRNGPTTVTKTKISTGSLQGGAFRSLGSIAITEFPSWSKDYVFVVTGEKAVSARISQ